ncbi:DUF4893 domain-containing protein [Roseomonas eburnea]|uniref:DUF4893 domain-containing protein n=1 Tax=Neoroseomonas eburnea TaxID=1346889 RepID=A0A9X9XH10_9PROT|nr:DUF4893 domain-containing protein [Neoroseomonas eburnea]MBR0682996.1 DUF4893 domain-containing protein [Neoroseomonas eburnea]
MRAWIAGGLTMMTLASPDSMAQGRRLGPGQEPAAVVAVVPGADWRSQAEARDRRRMAGLDRAWAAALESARRGGHQAEIAAEGMLLDPLAALDGAHPSGGVYRCRSLHVGAADGPAPAFVAQGAFRCRVWASFGVTYFEKIDGPRRMAGVIFHDGPVRSVLVGTEALGPETGFPTYGWDGERDRVAAVERIGPDRWRAVFPQPSNGAILEVMELVGPR